MARYRSGRLAGEIQKQVAQIISRDLKNPELELVSVLAVDASPDFSSARIYISPPPGKENDINLIAAALDNSKGYIRHLLGQRMKMRQIPELYFHIDNSIAYGVKMISMIDKQIEADKARAALRPPEEENKYEK